MSEPYFGFLHIGKTGGTALRALIEAHNKSYPSSAIRIFTHKTTLPTLFSENPDCVITFFIRDPIERFISGFNSRLRCGRPRYNVRWTEEENRAFSIFQTPNELGEALDPHSSDYDAARAAMNAIYHARLDLVHYLHSVAFLEHHKERIGFIGMLENFEQDATELRKILNIDNVAELPTDAVGAHRNPADMDRKLSPKATANLRQWYKTDYDIFRWCLKHRMILLDENNASL